MFDYICRKLCSLYLSQEVYLTNLSDNPLWHQWSSFNELNLYKWFMKHWLSSILPVNAFFQVKRDSDRVVLKLFAPLLSKSLLSQLKNRCLFSELTWQPLPNPRASQLLHALVWVLTHLPPDWVVAPFGWNHVLFIFMSLFNNEGKKIRVYYLFKNAYEHPSAHPHSSGLERAHVTGFFSLQTIKKEPMAFIWSKACFSLFLSTLSQGQAAYFWP